MKGVLLRSWLFFFIAILCSPAVKAQDFRFIYIQTEDQKSFYVKIDGQGARSASSGYVIIPRLTEGSYKINIGFPQGTLPELLLTVVLNESDAGYLIRKDVDQGVYIVNLQTMKFVATEIQWPVAKTRAAVKSNNEFARILSEVVNDSSINEIPVFTKYETSPKADLNKASVVSPLKPGSEVKPAQQPAIIENKASVLKLEQRNTIEGVFITYLDNADTVKLFMPVSAVVTPVLKKEKTDTLLVTTKVTQPVKDVRFIDMELANPNQQTDSGKIKKGDFVISEKRPADVSQHDSTGIKLVQEHASCKKIATEDDFLQLRKAIAAEKTATDMQKLAVNEFSSTCYSTEQVKNLGVLFITEEERYKFYVAAYPHVLDAVNFGTLESQLADSYYISRFKAMLNH